MPCCRRCMGSALHNELGPQHQPKHQRCSGTRHGSRASLRHGDRTSVPSPQSPTLTPPMGTITLGQTWTEGSMAWSCSSQCLPREREQGVSVRSPAVIRAGAGKMSGA